MNSASAPAWLSRQHGPLQTAEVQWRPGAKRARRRDPRVTRVGRVLQRTSLDELPQLFNVLKGEMSLVGPRTHALAHDARFGALGGSAGQSWCCERYGRLL